MKIRTAIKSGSVASQAANLGCQTLQSGASIFNSADLEAKRLIGGVTGATQSALHTAGGWLGLS